MKTVLTAWLLIAASTTSNVTAQEDFQTRLNTALAALDATEIEEGVSLLNTLLNGSMASTAPAQLRAIAHFRLGAGHFALDAVDSAQIQFADAIRVDPFFEPDPDLYQPNLVAASESARRTTLALGLRAPNDTILSPVPDRLPLDIAIGTPGELTIRVVRVDSSESPVTSATLAINERTLFPLPLLVRDSVAFEPGEYYVIATLMVPGVGSDSVVIAISLERLAADTLPHTPPPDSSLFLPEFEKGPQPKSSLVRGFLFGAAVIALPMLVASSDLNDGIEPRALAVGASISMGGIVGLLLGRPDVPIEANISANRQVMTGWEVGNQTIAEENRKRILLAPLHVRTMRDP